MRVEAVEFVRVRLAVRDRGRRGRSVEGESGEGPQSEVTPPPEGPVLIRSSIATSVHSARSKRARNRSGCPANKSTGGEGGVELPEADAELEEQDEEEHVESGRRDLSPGGGPCVYTTPYSSGNEAGSGSPDPWVPWGDPVRYLPRAVCHLVRADESSVGRA